MKISTPRPLQQLEAFVFLATVVIHFALSVVYGGVTLALINSGAVSVLAGLVWLLGLCALYVAALRMAISKRAPGYLLFVAAPALAYAAVKFGLPHIPALVAAFGSAIALLAALLSVLHAEPTNEGA
jgi:hypothetical protein